MPFGTPSQGTARRVYVGTTAPPSTLLGGLLGDAYPGDKATETTKFHNAFPSFTSVDEASRSITLRLKQLDGDTGQDVLKANFDSSPPPVIYCSILYNGVKGEYLPCVVSHWEPSSSGPTALGDLAVTLVEQGSPVDVAGGF